MFKLFKNLQPNRILPKFTIRPRLNGDLTTYNSQLKRGQSLVELLLIIGMTGILLPALFTGLMMTQEGKAQQQQRFDAISLLKETGEAVRVVRENGWASFAINGTYHPVVSGTTWVLSTGAETTPAGLTRQVEISDVRRDASGNIVTSGGNIDPSTKKIVITVSWTTPFNSSISTTSYLTRYLENASYHETKTTEFNAGTLNEVTVQATLGGTDNDGEIILGAGGNGNWCDPNLTFLTFNLDGSGVPTEITAVEGNAYITTGDNSSGNSFDHLAITNTRPPDVSTAGSFDGYKVNGLTADTGYVYLVTDDNQEELVIVRLSDHTKIGSYNLPNGTTKGVAINDNTLYMTVDNKLYNINVTTKSAPSQSGMDADGIILSGTPNRIYVVGNYIYVTLSESEYEMEIVNATSPSSLSLGGKTDIDPSDSVSGENGVDIYVNQTGNRAYLITDTNTIGEFFIIDTTTKTGNPPILGKYNTSGMDPRGITLVTGNRAIIGGVGGEEYQVVDISTESNPQRCGGSEVNGVNGIYGVASILESDNDAYSYIITGDADGEFRIIEGGPGGSYSTSGDFESATFDPGYSTANNRFAATFAEPANTEIKFQVSMANQVSGNCPTTGSYTFLGPDGTSSTYFTPATGESNSFPFTIVGNYSNPGQCIRYKIFLTTNDSTSTPVFKDITINYSP